MKEEFQKLDDLIGAMQGTRTAELGSMERMADRIGGVMKSNPIILKSFKS